MTRLFIHEVVTRDGFQIEPEFIPTAQKIALVDALSESGLHKIEVTSFVSPKAVPALADAEAVMAGIKRNPKVRYVALVANPRGAERALAAKVDEIVMVISVSESHNRANVRRSTDESFDGFAEIMQAIRGTAVGTACGMATTFGCPFEGFQQPERIYAFAQRLADLGIRGIALADTVGMGNPKQVLEISREAAKRLPHVELALHLHNTRGMGLANVVAGLDAGISALRIVARRPRRLPVRARRDREHLHRRPGAHAGEHGSRHRHRPRPADPRRARAAGARRARGAGPGDEGRQEHRAASAAGRHALTRARTWLRTRGSWVQILPGAP